MGKFEKQNRPSAYTHSPSPRSPEPKTPSPQGSRQGRSAPSQNRRSPSGKGRNRSLLPIILIGLVVGVGIVAGLLCVRFFGKSGNGGKHLIKKDVYVAGVNVGGLDREAALELLMQTYPYSFASETPTEGAQETVLAQIYPDHNLNVLLYATPEAPVLYKGTYDPSLDVPVDIYGKPMSQTSADGTQPEATEHKETESAETSPEDPNTPLTEDGQPYLLDKTIVLPSSQVKPTLNLTAAVEAAFAVGREGGPQLQDGIHNVDLLPYLTLDESYLRDVLDSTYEDTFSEGTETVVEESKTTVVGEDNKEIQADCLVITFGTPGRRLDTDALFDRILSAYSNAEFELRALYEESLPATLDLDELYKTYNCTMPVNAVCSEGTFEITPETLGYGFLMKDALALAENAQPGDRITLTLTELKPQHTKAEMEATLFSDVLGSCVSSPHVYNPTRTHNLELASQAINGTILLPGEEFSFNRIVGERTAEKGYGEAGVYVGGRTENQLGGGVCQVASAIYYSCLKADLEITERYEHQYTPTYVPWGMDATIYWGSLDYRFVNNTPYPLRIDASVHDGSVYVDLVGTETRDYTVELNYSVIKEDPAEEKTVYIHPDMANYSSYSGYSDGETIQTAYNGYTVKAYMYKYDSQGNLIDTLLINTSEYDRRDREIACVLDASRPMDEQIAELENPTEPTEPSTEPTEPSTEPTEPSTEPTEPSTEPTEPPTEPTEPPTESTEPPTEPTEPPTEPTEPPTEPTEPPTEPTEPPTEPAPSESESTGE